MKSLSAEIGQASQLEDLLYPALLVLVRAGLADETICQHFNAALDKARKAPPQANLRNLPNVETTREVVSVWTTNPKYQTVRGAPKVLKKQGPNSFQALVAEASGDAAWEEILSNLISLDNVSVTSTGRIRLLRNFLLVKTTAELAYEPTLRFISDACRAASSSLEGGPGKEELEKYWRAVELSGLTEKIERQFYIYTKKRTLQLLQELNEWLVSRRTSIPRDGLKYGRRRVGLGVFFVSGREI